MPQYPQFAPPPRRPWAVSFPLRTVYLGCLVTALAFLGMVYLTLVVLTAEVDAAAAGVAPGRLAFLIGVVPALIILVVGPLPAFGLGWLLRDVANQSLHLIAFAVAGAVVGALIGLAVGGPQLANLLAAVLGAAAGVGRMAVTPLARIPRATEDLTD